MGLGSEVQLLWEPAPQRRRRTHLLDDRMRTKIDEHLRRTCSPRHPPDSIVEVPAIPATVSGKERELPMRRIQHPRAGGRGAMADPAALDAFAEYARTRAASAP